MKQNVQQSVNKSRSGDITQTVNQSTPVADDKYKIVMDNNVATMNRDVSRLLHSGWRLHGDMKMTKDKNETVYAQVLVR